MGLWRPLIGKGLEVAPSAVNASDRLLTPANAMTAARPILAVKAARMLLRGEHPVTPIIFYMSVSDAEGNVARLIDKYFPESGFGSSKIGAEWDPIADTLALLQVSGAALFAPRLNKVSKLAVATALGHEGFKAAWAIGKNQEYGKLTGERLQIKPTIEGKESMAEKFSAIGLATLSSDFEHSPTRGILSAAALGMAVTGSLRAERQRVLYDEIANQLIDEAQK